MTISGTNNFEMGAIVSFSGFTPSLLNLTGIELGPATTTGPGGAIQYTYDFGQNLSGPYSTTGTVSRTGAAVSQVAVTVDGITQGPQLSSIVFFSADQAALCSSTTGPVIYTFSGDAATSNATTLNINSTTNVVVRNATLPELFYTGATKSLMTYAKQY
jgi:hypothetical protein